MIFSIETLYKIIGYYVGPSGFMYMWEKLSLLIFSVMLRGSTVVLASGQPMITLPIASQ